MPLNAYPTLGYEVAVLPMVSVWENADLVERFIEGGLPLHMGIAQVTEVDVPWLCLPVRHQRAEE
jgi:hypothetical protein